MAGKFVDINGATKKGRSQPAIGRNIFEDDVKDPARLVDILSAMSKRIEALERNSPADFIEFEKSMPSSGTVSLEHNFGCPVRYFIVHWKGSANPGTSVDEINSTTKMLVLNSYVAGRATIRVERSQYDVKKGSV